MTGPEQHASTIREWLEPRANFAETGATLVSYERLRELLAALDAADQLRAALKQIMEVRWTNNDLGHRDLPTVRGEVRNIARAALAGVQANEQPSPVRRRGQPDKETEQSAFS